MCNSSRPANVRVTDFCQVLSLLFPLCIKPMKLHRGPTPLPGNSKVSKDMNDKDMIQPPFLTSSVCLPLKYVSGRLSAYHCGVSISFRFQVFEDLHFRIVNVCLVVRLLSF